MNFVRGTLPDVNTKTARLPRPEVVRIGPGAVGKLTQDGIGHEAVTWTPDGKSIIFRGMTSGHAARLYVQNVSGGAPRPITPEGVSATPFCSPDGRWVWIRAPDRTSTLYSLNGGAQIKLTAMTAEDWALGWSPDGKSLRYFRRNANPVQIFTLDVATGGSQLWKEIALPEAVFGALSFRMSADGRTYAYSVVSNAADIYIAENVK